MYLQGHFWSIVISMNESFTYSIVSCYWKYIHQKLLRSIVCWAKAWLLWLIFFMIIAQGVKEPKRLHEKQNQQGSLLALPRCLSLLGFKAVGKTVNLPIYLVWVHSESNKTNFSSAAWAKHWLNWGKPGKNLPSQSSHQPCLASMID